MNFVVQLEQEADERWIAEVVDIPGALAYGQSQEEALAELRRLRCAPSQTDSSTVKSKLTW